MDDELQFKCAYPDKLSRGMKDMIQNLPPVVCGAEISVIDNDEACDRALAEISKETMLGFDTETRPSHKAGESYPVSILQLASEKRAWIFRLSKLEGKLKEIFSILENPRITKVGVGVSGDLKGLRKLCDFKDAGFEHIEKLVEKLPLNYTGLRNLTAVFTGMRLSKSAQMSNWAADTLTRKQVEYAATDAWISLLLYREIEAVLREKRYLVMPERPPEPTPFSFGRFLRKCARTVMRTLRFENAHCK